MRNTKSIGDKILSNRICGKVCMWLVIFTSFYYPIGAFFILTLKVPSTPVNIALKAGAAGAALYLIALALINKRKTLTIPTPVWFILIFWIVYSVRLLYDMNIADVHFGGKPDSLVYGYAFGNILLPLVAMVFWYKFIDIKEFAHLTFKFFFVANLLVFIILLQQNGGFNLDLFVSRAAAMSEKEDIKELVLNPITIGFYGGLLSITSLYFMLVIKKTRIWIYVPLFLFGLLMLVLGASRGPFISTIATLLIVIFYRFRISYSKLITFFKMLLIIIVTGVVVSKSMGDNVSLENFQMYNRLSRLLEDRQNDRKETRDLAWASAWQDFLDSPLVGKQFVGTFDQFYPHNIVLEIPMATGLLGSFFFLGFFIPLLIKIFKSYLNRDHEYFFLSIVFAPIFIGRLFSGCLYMSIDLWLVMTIMVAINVQRKAKIIHVRESKLVSQKSLAYNLQA